MRQPFFLLPIAKTAHMCYTACIVPRASGAYYGGIHENTKFLQGSDEN
jgi:hypothetical protein